jgi:hypothetical protein
MKQVLFYDPHANERGTSAALFDYAMHNQSILGNKSHVAVGAKGAGYERLTQHFDVSLVSQMNVLNDLNDLIFFTGSSHFYMLKAGANDGILVDSAKNLVHAVFPIYEPHGDVYAYVSDWLARDWGQGCPSVPHMIATPSATGDLRQELGIPADAFVFGWYGGGNFEIPFVRQAVEKAASARPDARFLFMNCDRFTDGDRVVFLPCSIDPTFKSRFVNSCDAMLHANSRGETFGISVGEFAVRGKPVIAYDLSGTDWERPGKAHLDHLGEACITYSDYDSVLELLMSLSHADVQGRDWVRYHQFTPETVMEIFERIFLSGKERHER